MSAGRALLLAAAVLAAPSPAAAVRATIDQPFAILQGLDKITARISRLDVPVGAGVVFGTLAITVRACRTTPPEEAPENAAFLEIVDRPPGEEPRLVFSGWMFSSSPAVSALDHPVLDVWVVRCAQEPPREPEDMGAPTPLFSLPANPPLPPGVPDFRLP
jgi:hypothetical protein